MLLSSALLIQVGLVALTSAVMFGGDGPYPQCHPGEYRSPALIGPRCLPCSRCPRNHIVRQPCTLESDTVCGPFYEFDSFTQGEGGPKGSVGKHSLNGDIQDLVGQGDNTLTALKYSGPSVHDDVEHWKELCYGLIAALVMVALLSAVFIIMLHRRATKAHSKMITIQPDSDDPTVYYHTHQLAVPMSQSPGGAPSTVPLLPNGQPGITITVPSNLVHLEAQVQRNTQRRSLLGRYLLPGRPRSWAPGNEYVDTQVRLNKPTRPMAAITEAESLNSVTPSIQEQNSLSETMIPLVIQGLEENEEVVVVS